MGNTSAMPRYRIYASEAVASIAVGVALVVFSGQILAAFGISQAAYGQVFAAAITIVFGYLTTWSLASSILDYGARKPRMDEKPLSKIISLMGYIVILFLVLSLFHVNLTGLLIGAGFLGIVIGLAAQSTLGNLFSGVSMMAAKPFANGDRVTFSTWQYGMLPPSYAHRTILPGYSGTIDEIGLIYTRMRLDDGTVLYVPNGIMNQAVIMNYEVSDVIEINVRVELPQGADFGAFKRGLLAEIGKHKRLGSAMKGRPDVIITDINISNYGIDIKARSTVENERYVKAELSKVALHAAGASSRKGS